MEWKGPNKRHSQDRQSQKSQPEHLHLWPSGATVCQWLSGMCSCRNTTLYAKLLQRPPANYVSAPVPTRMRWLQPGNSLMWLQKNHSTSRGAPWRTRFNGKPQKLIHETHILTQETKQLIEFADIVVVSVCKDRQLLWDHISSRPYLNNFDRIFWDWYNNNINNFNNTTITVIIILILNYSNNDKVKARNRIKK